MRSAVPEKLEAARELHGPWGSLPAWGFNGLFRVQGPCGAALKIVASDSQNGEQDWEHVSVSAPRRPPNWQEMCFVKDLFWEPEETVMQLHPPRSQWISNHPTCLHLWLPLKERIPTPPSEMVGVQGWQPPLGWKP